jgi:hypothetical protein
MRLSISNSKSAALVYSKVLAGICAILVIVFEISANYVVKHYSETYARVSKQYPEAVKVCPAKPGEPASVLMVGNSLLMEGINLNRLQELTSSRMRIYPIFLEATGYYDWLYGLQRLFRQGARPQVVVLGLGVNTFFENAVRQDYAPMMLFDARDILGVASDLKLDHTSTSNLLLAHESVFWDTRSVIRTQILRRVVPHCEELFSFMKAKPIIPQGPRLEALVIARVQTLHKLCEAHGAKLIILVPPTPSSEDATRQMASVSQKIGVDTLVPIDPATLSEQFYQRDEIHLNPAGATLFTSALVSDLRKKIMIRETTASPD